MPAIDFNNAGEVWFGGVEIAEVWNRGTQLWPIVSAPVKVITGTWNTPFAVAKSGPPYGVFLFSAEMIGGKLHTEWFAGDSAGWLGDMFQKQWKAQMWGLPGVKFKQDPVFKWIAYFDTPVGQKESVGGYANFYTDDGSRILFEGHSPGWHELAWNAKFVEEPLPLKYSQT